MEQLHLICPVRLCFERRRKSWHLVCDTHWKILPKEAQDQLYEAYKTNPYSEEHKVLMQNTIHALDTLTWAVQ